MKRSVSRRSVVGHSLGQSPAPRSRSAERSMKQPGEGIVLDFDDELEDMGAGSFEDDEGLTTDDDEGDTAAILIPHLHGTANGSSIHSNGNHNKHSHNSHGSHGHHHHHHHSHSGNRARLSSDSSISKQVRCHRRAMSDPFDTADSEGVSGALVDAVFADNGLVEEEQNALPTLQRFPFAENNDKNCWSEPPVNIFSVRGPHYLKDKKKATAKRFMLQARGCDLFLSDKPNEVKISSLKGALGGNLRKKPSLLIRLTFPWGMLIQYYEVPPMFAPYMRPGPSPPMEDLKPAEKTLAKWLGGDQQYKNERLKLISYVADGPWIVRNLVTGKPALIGKKLPVSYTYTPKDGSKQDFLECDLDIGNSSKTAKKIVSVCRRYMSALSVDIGFVIEGKTQDELPEEMMGAIRVHEVDPIQAPAVH